VFGAISLYGKPCPYAVIHGRHENWLGRVGTGHSSDPGKGRRLRRRL